ncbi:glycosyltransferase family 2 protein [Subsaxibacter sp. CAU 1640]|uniref:glycosyltransferase family 2 protein n=1 Tax=Subsaxibacter sp. CAU 1640 TaxID=2933271 RepID=UPI00200625CC|nr:glycosyltransferase family 2 protein [Subsaxibacter sp. CAU 1640]MCK7589901.1 glycosyltransferase family 2 protein [Subsaxibacter sp. CAU 1640]
MDRPLVSIVIPYFNRPEKLQRCLQSIYNQSYDYFEIIVVDDCSDIEPNELPDAVHYIRLSKNSGPGAARNEGLRIAKGIYIAFLDCDDYWHKDFLSKLINALANQPDIVMAYSLSYNMQNGASIGVKKKERLSVRNAILPDILFKSKAWATSACLWRFDLIKHKQFPNHRNWEDYVFDIKVAIDHNSVFCLQEYLTYYDVTGDDKLSADVNAHALMEKNKSICLISDVLYKSDYRGDFIINKYISLLLVSHMKRFKSMLITDMTIYEDSLIELKKWNSSIFVAIIRFGLKLNNRMGLKVLDVVKRQLKNSTVHNKVKE